jgi:hypothetical protein
LSVSLQICTGEWLQDVVFHGKSQWLLYSGHMTERWGLLTAVLWTLVGHYSPTGLVDHQSIDNDQICEVKEELLCPLPGSPAPVIAGGHLVTFAP